MDERSQLIQGLLVVLAFSTIYAQVNTRPYVPGGTYWRPRPQYYHGFQHSCCSQNTGIAFPGEAGFPDVAINNRFEPIKTVRTRERPSCTLLSDDPSAPCDEDREYDDRIKQLVSGLLARSRSVNEIISDPALSVILNDSLTPPPPPNGFEPATRFGGPRESPACVSREELIFPQRAKTPKNDWVFVVNQEGVRQALRVERCNKEGEKCQIGIPNTRDVSTVCRQKHVYRRMLVVGSNNIEPEEVLMPSCCVCYIRRNFDISSRTGINTTTTSESNPGAQPAASGPQTGPTVPQPIPVVPQHGHVTHARPVQPIGTPIGFTHNRRRSSEGYNLHNTFYYPTGPGRR